MLAWLGKKEIAPAVKATKATKREPSPLRRPERMVLGVLGTRSIIRFEDIETNWLAPIQEAWGTPDAIVLPGESDSSQAIQTWALTKEIPVQLIPVDWAKQGRCAGVLRDAQIQRHATHFLLLQGPRSNALMALALRLQKKGYPVVISERPGEPVAIPIDNRCSK
jgi:hypothetical protein